MIFSIGHSTHEPDKFLALMRGVQVLIDIRSHPNSKWEWWRRENMGWIADAGIELIWEPRLGGWTAQHFARYHEQMAQVGVDVGAYSKGVFPKQRIGVALNTDANPACPRHGSGPKAPSRDHLALIRSAARRDTPDPTAICCCEGVSDMPRWTNRGLWDYSWYETTDEFHAGLLWLFENYGADDAPNAAIMCAEACFWKCHRSMVADALFYRFACDTRHLKPSLPKRPTTSRFQTHSSAIGNRIQRYEPEILASLRAVGR